MRSWLLSQAKVQDGAATLPFTSAQGSSVLDTRCSSTPRPFPFSVLSDVTHHAHQQCICSGKGLGVGVWKAETASSFYGQELGVACITSAHILLART